VELKETDSHFLHQRGILQFEGFVSEAEEILQKSLSEGELAQWWGKLAKRIDPNGREIIKALGHEVGFLASLRQKLFPPRT
jgi:hypothetical protein